MIAVFSALSEFPARRITVDSKKDSFRPEYQYSALPHSSAAASIRPWKLDIQQAKILLCGRFLSVPRRAEGEDDNSACM